MSTTPRAPLAAVKAVLTVALALAALAGCGNQSGAQQPARPDSAGARRADSAAAARRATDSALAEALRPRTKGSMRAPVTVYEMSDFQCPFCARHALETFPTLEREYIETGKVRWVFINFPLTAIHANATPAAEFAMCASRWDKFWPAHDILFRNQRTWGPLKEAGPYLLGLADSLSLPRDSVLACLQAPETRAVVQGDAEGAARAGANSTPTFFIEGGLLSGAYPVDVFRQVLDSIYREKSGAGKAGKKD